jgi:hypothetical protein
MTTEELKQKFINEIKLPSLSPDDYTAWLEQQLIKHHEALQLAGKLALAADLVWCSNAINLSLRIEVMKYSLNDYDSFILSMNERK